MGDLAGCADGPGGVDVGGHWARRGEGQRCAGREARRKDAEAASGQERACQRSGDLWDVRAAGPGILAERAGDPFLPYSPSLF